MKRHAIIALVAVLALLLGSAIGAQPAQPPAPPVYLPNIQAPQQPALVRLVASDTTFVSAARDESTGRVYVNYIDRAHGNKLHLTELVNDRLVDLVEPPNATTVAALLATRAAAPAFSPDSPKEADSATLAWDGWQHVFFSARPLDKPTGPFELWYWRFVPQRAPP